MKIGRWVELALYRLGAAWRVLRGDAVVLDRKGYHFVHHVLAQLAEDKDDDTWRSVMGDIASDLYSSEL